MIWRDNFSSDAETSLCCEQASKLRAFLCVLFPFVNVKVSNGYLKHIYEISIELNPDVALYESKILY